MLPLSIMGSTSRHMDSDNNMPGVSGKIKKDSLETGEEKRDLGSKPKKIGRKKLKDSKDIGACVIRCRKKELKACG